MERLAYIVLPYFLCGTMDAITGTIRGMGYSIAPAIATVVGVCVFRVGWIQWIFPMHRTLSALYVSYPISWLMTAAVEYGMFLFFFRRLLQRQPAAAAEVTE